jgi:hypothetical protein
MKIRCAQYSKLAAVTVPNPHRSYNFISLYYQVPPDAPDIDDDSAIKVVSYSGYTLKWSPDKPNLTDPPLYGTSLAAVLPRKGILVGNPKDEEAASQPVYYLQMDSLHLGNAQGTSGMHTPCICVMNFISDPYPSRPQDNGRTRSRRQRATAFPPHQHHRRRRRKQIVHHLQVQQRPHQDHGSRQREPEAPRGF